jgi:hypothetical protein
MGEQMTTISDAMFMAHLNGVLDERERVLNTIVTHPATGVMDVDDFKSDLVAIIKKEKE